MTSNQESDLKTPDRRTRKTRVFLVDDHAMMRRGLTELINGETGMEVCGEAATLGDAYSEIGKTNPDLVIVDIALDGNDGMELTKDIIRRWPNLPILVYSMHDETIYAERALRAGAKGYVMKRHPPEVLLDGISQILRGKTFLSEQMSDRLIGKMVGAGASDTVTRAPIDKLSDRELEVFQLIGKGLSTNDIAEQLCLSVKTIETYRGHLKTKLNLRTGNELVRYAIEWSLERS
jgi:DNA-binding NarL/FixJ family response regulator